MDIEPLKVIIGDIKANGDEFTLEEWDYITVQETHYEFNLDDELRKLGLLVGISEEMYYCSISRISTLYLETLGQNG